MNYPAGKPGRRFYMTEHSDEQYCKQCGILLDEETRNSENTQVTDICVDCFDMNLASGCYDTDEEENKK